MNNFRKSVIFNNLKKKKKENLIIFCQQSDNFTDLKQKTKKKKTKIKKL